MYIKAIWISGPLFIILSQSPYLSHCIITEIKSIVTLSVMYHSPETHYVEVLWITRFIQNSHNRQWAIECKIENKES